MPRLSPSLLVRAHNISPYLPLLLQTCRTLPSARNELRWLQEHVSSKKNNPKVSKALILYLCQQRARGVPLQYLLGSQPFGDLDILCSPGVLIPRPETEAYTSYLASGILQSRSFAPSSLKILDLCTGTGCISLYLHFLLCRKFINLSICGIDISTTALALADANRRHNLKLGHLHPDARDRIFFRHGDVLSAPFSALTQSASVQKDTGQQKEGTAHETWDIVICNPPYISASGFARETSRSVRNWEPKLALVPPSFSSSIQSFVQSQEQSQNRNLDAVTLSHQDMAPEDIFYPRILSIAHRAEAQVVLVEVADTAQALRVADLALGMQRWNRVEVWRDWPGLKEDGGERGGQEDFVDLRGEIVRFKGVGSGRSVVCWR